ncbi:MAG: hypothetical protein LBS56_00140 [Propionibacteriaceae bacterium]|jgi:hypothetical protein|nr:hypothetical protein [Propionibacteriaceae bacterium]
MAMFAHDLRVGFSPLTYAAAAVVFAVLCLVAQSASQDSTPGRQLPAWPDYLVFFVRGVPIPVEGQAGLGVPVVWLMPQVILALLVAAYPTRRLGGYAVQTLHRVGGRAAWWMAKWLWLVATVVAFYAVAAGVALLFSLFTDSVALEPRPQVELAANGLDVAAVSLPALYGALAAPVVASVAVATVQMVLAFAWRAQFAFLAVIAYLAASGFAHSPLLLGGNAMVLRNRLFDPAGSSTGTMCLISLGATAAAVLVGLWTFQRRDLLPG